MKHAKLVIALLMVLAIAFPAYALRPTAEQQSEAKARPIQQDVKMPVNQQAEQAVAALAAKGAAPRIDWNRQTGFARSVADIAVPVDAAAFLKTHGALFGIQPDLSGLTLRNSASINGVDVSIYDQSMSGLPVFNGQVRVTSSQGAVRLVIAELLPDTRIDATPSVSAAQAVAAATANLNSRNLVTASRGELGILPDKGQARLAYKVALRSDDPLGYYIYYIDARSGAMIRRSNEMPFVTGSGTVYLNNPVVGGTSTQSFPNLDGSGNLKGTYAKALNEDVAVAYNASNVFSYTTTDTHFDENMAYFHVDRIHNYYKATLGYTGMDAVMTATVHVGTNYANAYYDPATGQIYFGDGDNSSIFDTAKEECVIYHEYTHAVTDKIVGLTYSGQSGAMSEGYSDYFSCSFTNDAIIGEYVMPSYKRVLTTHKTMDNWYGEVHADGEIWGHVLWECRSDASIGATVMDKATFTGISSLTSGATFVDGLNGILNADQSIYSGIHKTVIQNIFANHGIGSAPVAQNDAGSGADAGNSFAAALQLSPGSYTCLLNTTDRDDYFKFNVTSGQVIKVKITPPSTADFDLYLYNPSQTQVGSSTAGAGIADSVVYTATVTGAFYAKAYEYSGTGNYSLLISVSGGTTPTPTLAISSTSWAPAAAGGTSSAISVSNSGTTSVIAYTVASNQTWLTVSSASGSTPGSFTMTAGANTTTSSRSATVTVTATTAGVSGSPKTIAVSQAAGTGGQNDAGSGADAGNTFALATLVSPGSWTGCYLDATDRNDYYKFNVTSGQVIKVKITPPSSADYDLYLYNPSQTQVGSSTAGTGIVDSVVYTATVSGTFYAKAYEYSGTGNYSLLISTGGTTPTTILAVSSTSWAPVAAGGTSSAINVTNSGTSGSVIAYTVASNQTWLTVSAASGNTPGSFTMTAAANSGAARSATVTVAATGQTSKTIAVSQAAGGSGTWTDVAATTQSAHPYANNYNNTWTITGPAGATKMKVYFDSIKTETRYDSVFVLNSAGTVIQSFTGTYRAVWSSEVTGNVVKIKLKSDGSVTGFGFRSNKYSYYTAAAARNELILSLAQAKEFTELLCQNRPNPVAQGTQISFNLSAGTPVSLKIYNLNGQLVKTLVSGAKPAGHHTIDWDGRDETGRAVTAGAYIYRLVSGDVTAVKRMMVIR